AVMAVLNTPAAPALGVTCCKHTSAPRAVETSQAGWRPTGGRGGWTGRAAADEVRAAGVRPAGLSGPRAGVARSGVHHGRLQQHRRRLGRPADGAVLAPAGGVL